MSNRAWVTLATNDSYGLGALVLANSLRRASSAHPAVVLITPSVTEAMRDRLSAVFAEVVTVDVLDSRDAAHLALLQRPELGITFTKIHCWGLTQYEKCVFLDADTLIIQNCDELFEREELSAAPDVGWPDCFNSGVFVYKPSQETFEQLIKFAQERGSFDGGDQGLLNSFFSDWARGDINKHLPFLYNVTSAAFYSYLPALKHYGQNLKIIHFIGAAKPWLQKFNWESRSVDAPEHLREFLQLWWDLFVGQVHPQLDESMSGVAGNLARVVPGASGAQREALDELTRRQGWEAGNIDYMGADSFDKIWAKISQTLSQPRTSPPKQPSPPKEPVPVEVAQEATTVDAAPEEVTPAPTPIESAPVETPKAPEAQTETPQAKTPVVEAAVVEAPAKVVEAPALVAQAPAPVPEVPAQVTEAPSQVASAPAQVAEAPKPAPAAPALIAPEQVLAVLETAAETKAPAEVPASEIPVTVEAAADKEVSTTVEACAPGEAPVPVAAPVEATPAPQPEPEKTEKPAPPTPPATPKSSEASTPVTESAPQVEVETLKEAPAPVVATPKKPSETSQVSTDSPPLATTPTKEEASAPAAKSEERRKPAGKLQLRPPSVADPLPTPDSELEDAAALAQSIIASELRTPTVTSPSPAAPAAPLPSPPALTQDARLSVDEPQVPTPPVGAAVSLAQIGVKPKAKPTTASQIESSVAEKPTEPSAPSDPPKKKVVKKVVKKEGDAPVPPPRKKEKKPKEK